MITRDGAKMSKSKGNTVSPSDYVDRYGADAARCYILFVRPSSGWRGATGPTRGITGVTNFLARLYRAAADAVPRTTRAVSRRALSRKAHWAIDKVTRDLGQRVATHTSISAAMELVNEIHRNREDPPHSRLAIATAASLIFPFAPTWAPRSTTS